MTDSMKVGIRENIEYITNYYPRVYQNGEWLGSLGFIARVNGHLSLKHVT